MPELRQNFFRSGSSSPPSGLRRPEELARQRAVQSVVSFPDTCPLCLGNESKTPPEGVRFPIDAGQLGRCG
jgi:galactose-1-phosphate uridylyltransferase